MMDKIKGILDTKNKKIVAIAVAMSVVVISAFSVYAIRNAGNKQILKVVKSIDVEYGETIPTDVKGYLDVSGLTKEEKTKLWKNAKVSIKDIQKEEEQTYPKIGEYKAIVVYQDEKHETKVVVKDTIAPVFNEVDSVQIEQGTTEFNYHEHIQATDLQEITYEFKTENIDVNTVGEYTMAVVATDTSGNVVEKEVQVVIIEKAQELEELGTDNNTNTSNNQTSNNTSSNNNTNNRNNNSNTTNNDTNSNSANTNNNTGNTGQKPTPQPEETHKHAYANEVSKWFSSESDADTWAWDYLDNQSFPCEYHGYQMVYCSCGQFGIIFY